MYDLIVIGSGPGGYPAAIRACQLNLKVALVEKSQLGGVCLNWGCIPTKALLKSASVYDSIMHAKEYGIDVEHPRADLSKIVERSRGIASMMSKGVEFLLQKNGVEVIPGFGKIVSANEVEVAGVTYQAKNIIIATGARPREMPGIVIDGVRVINSKQALILDQLPQNMIVIGSGAIGAEFATLYNTLGSKVTLVEYANRVAPLEDAEISATLERALRKSKMTILTSTSVEKVEAHQDGCKVFVQGKKGAAELSCDVVLSAVGISSNIEGIGLEQMHIAVDRGKIVVNDHYQTCVPNIYAIGDVISTPALAHVATAEAICAVEFIAGLAPKKIDYNIIPSCIYTTPEVSSVGLTQDQAIEQGHEVRVGKFPFTASGKATAASARDGMVKLIFDAKSDLLLGAHFVGLNVTEMVGQTTLAMKLGATAKQIINTIHCHPTMHEAIMEAAAAAHNEAIHV